MKSQVFVSKETGDVILELYDKIHDNRQTYLNLDTNEVYVKNHLNQLEPRVWMNIDTIFTQPERFFDLHDDGYVDVYVVADIIKYNTYLKQWYIQDVMGDNLYVFSYQHVLSCFFQRIDK